MVGKQMSVTLPDEVVAKILAMVPFPYVFKARLLSKLWLARCSSIASQEDEEKKRLIKSFQEQVGECSTTKWKTFCPIFFRKDDFIGYDRESQRWQRLPSLSFLPERLFIASDWCQMEGALVLVHTWRIWMTGGFKMYVANILTRTWKLLPPRPYLAPSYRVGAKCLIHISLQTYKVVVFEDDVRERSYCCAVYDSELDTWSRSKPFDTDLLLRSFSNLAYLDGVLYRACRTCGPNYLRGLLAFNLKEATFEVIQLPKYRGIVHLAVCKATLLMLRYDSHTTAKNVIVLEIDLRSRQFLEVTRGPPADLYVGKFHTMPVIAGDCLFFTGAEVQSGILSYNFQEDEWTCFPRPANVQPVNLKDNYNAQEEYKWGNFSFQPGLNPFVAV